MDCSTPGSSVHGDSPGKNTGVYPPILSPGELPDPGIEQGSPALQANFYQLRLPGKLPMVFLTELLLLLSCFSQVRLCATP